jgi:tetratricopeptide (TPR) repeat protein
VIGQRTLAVLVLVTALAASVAFAQTPTSFRDKALAADARNDTAAALAALNQGLKASPTDAGLLAARGQIYWRLLRTKSAEQALIAAAKTPAFAAEAQYWLGRIYFFKGYQAEGAFPGWHEEVSYRPRALRAFTAARQSKPTWYLPHVGLGDIAKAEGRDSDAQAEYARAAELGRPATTAETDAAVKTADAVIAKLQAVENAPIADVRAAIEARLAVRPDPMSYAAGANMLLARRAELPYVAKLAVDGRAAGELFIKENESSYKLDGKVTGSLDRNQATFADIAGWAAFIQGDMKTAETRLAEAARLSRNLDPINQMHLGQLSRTNDDLENAREHYLTVMALAASTPPQREAAKTALRDVQAKSGENPMEFDKWLTATLDRKREERRKALVSTMAGKKLPALVLTDLQGNKIDLLAERGNVVLLNFFSAW